jgi:hypothetical protein
LLDLTNRGLVQRWQTREGAPRSSWYGPGWQLTAEGRRWLAQHLVADSAPASVPEVKPVPAPTLVKCEPAPAPDPALAVLKAIAAQHQGALDVDVAGTVHSPNERELAYAQLRVRGYIRVAPLPLVPRVFKMTPAGWEHLGKADRTPIPPVRALVVRPCVAVMVIEGGVA